MEGDLPHTPHYDSLSLKLLRVDLLNTSHVSGLIHADKMPQSVLFLLYLVIGLIYKDRIFFLLLWFKNTAAFAHICPLKKLY